MLFIFIIVVIFLIAGLIASYFLFFKNKLTIKKNDFIQRKCSYLFFLINGKINEYIERLAYISKKNPFYIDKYNCFLSEFKVLTDESEKVNLILKDIQDSVYRKNFLEVRKKIFNNKKKILDFEKQVLEINNNLIKIFVSEEDQRQSFAILDKKIKNIQNFFINEKKNLVFFQNKYNFLFLIFKELQKKFEDFLDIGEFNESKKILKKIDVFVKNFENFNNVITDIYIILSEINSKIPIFEKKFTSLIKEGHDLYKLVFEHILFVKNNLITVFRRIKLLKLEKIKEDLLLINNKIDELYDLLNKEKNASENFLKELEIVDKQIYFLEYFFNNFCILFNQISKIYILEKNDIFNFNN